MKNYQSILIIFTLAILTSFGAQAVDIVDTYTAGDPVTVTIMDNVKAAVNSKQNIVTEDCGPNASISKINANGTATCVNDTFGTGDITGVTAGTGLTGGGTSGTVTLQIDTIPAFRATKSVAQNFAQSASATLSFNTEVFDSGGDYNSTTSTFVTPVAGFYHFTCSVLPESTFTANGRLSIGGDMVQVSPGWPAFQTITVTSDRFFTANTDVTCGFFDNSVGGNSFAASGFNRFTGFLVR